MEDIDLGPVLEPTRHKQVYVAGCLREMDHMNLRVAAYREQLLGHMGTLVREIRDHLWVADDFAVPAARNLAATLRQVDTLQARVARLREGFENLPREAEANMDGSEPETPPAAVARRIRK